MLHIVADENMPGLEAFSALGMVERHVGRGLHQADLKAADVLLVRSVTRVNASLLQGTPVRFVGSATIGTDHVDLDWLARAGIAFAHAPGCNAQAVVEYVLQAMLSWCERQARQPTGLTIGIVGLGNVGARLASHAAALGMTVRPCDPPRQQQGDILAWPWVPLEQALGCDVVSLHVPLTKSGAHATHHLLGQPELGNFNNCQLLINTCRGEVIDNGALLHQLDQQPFDCVLDVWEGEPWISRELFSRVWLGSPHVAGYSLEGKLRGSWMLLTALSRWAGEEVILPSLPQAGRLEQSLRDWRDVLHLLQRPWQIRVDHDRLAASLQEDQPALAFDELRKRYPVRHELSAFQLSGKRAPEMQRLVSLLSGG